MSSRLSSILDNLNEVNQLKTFSDVINFIPKNTKENKYELINLSEKEEKVKLLKLLCDLKNNSFEEKLYYIGKVEITQQEIKTVEKAIQLRNDINQLKGVSDIPEYQRDQEDKINFQAMITELMFSKFLWDHYKSIYREIKKDIEVRSPEIASVFLNKKEEDFYIKYKEIKINFDMKSQFIDNKQPNININKKSHARFIDHKTDFYVVGLINGCPKTFEGVNEVHFIMLTKDYFDKNSISIDTSTNPRFSPHYRLKIQPFLNIIKGEK